MQTIKQWLEQLPPRYRDRAIRNAPLLKLLSEAKSFQGALDEAFTWELTPEGADFWCEVDDHMRDGSGLPPLPKDEPNGIEAMVCDDIALRQKFGVNKYGTTVADNPLPLKAWLKHAYEESLDLPIYLRRAMEEPTSKMNELIANVLQWGKDKGITGPGGKGTPLGQLEKTQEELTETRDATVRYLESRGRVEHLPAIRDGIGDCVVTLILFADLVGVDLQECLQLAYDEIKGRTGRMENGVFIKDK